MNADILPPQSIDFNNDGRIGIADLSIMAFQIIAPFDPRFDLNRDGKNTLADLSIFFTRMRE
jgi:hypothetical protein